MEHNEKPHFGWLELCVPSCTSEMEVARSSEMLITNHMTRQCHTPKDHNLCKSYPPNILDIYIPHTVVQFCPKIRILLTSLCCHPLKFGLWIMWINFYVVWMFVHIFTHIQFYCYMSVMLYKTHYILTRIYVTLVNLHKLWVFTIS